MNDQVGYPKIYHLTNLKLTLPCSEFKNITSILIKVRIEVGL